MLQPTISVKSRSAEHNPSKRARASAGKRLETAAYTQFRFFLVLIFTRFRVAMSQL